MYVYRKGRLNQLGLVLLGSIVWVFWQIWFVSIVAK